METYIKEIQMNGRSITSIDNANKIVSWLSSIITELEETDGNVIISKVDGSQIVIPIDNGLSIGDLNDRLDAYFTKNEVNDLINEIKLQFDNYITDDRFRMIMDINSGDCGGCGDSCGGGCGFNTCCLNFLTAFVDNRECCGGITLIDNMGNQINLLEGIEVRDIVETEPGTFHVTKCNDEFDIVVGDQVIDNGDGTYTVNPGDGRPSFDINHTQAIDNGDGTYTFINYDGNSFTIDLDILPTLSKWLIYDHIGLNAWYPLTIGAGGSFINAIPVPGYNLLDFQNIDVIWTDIDVDTGVTGNSQHNQYTHNGNLLNETFEACTDMVGSFGLTTVYPYAYGLYNDYTIEGGTIATNVADDIGLGYITVSSGVPMTDITRVRDMVDKMSPKQRSLLFKTADEEINTAYHMWCNYKKYGYENHIKIARLLSVYLNTDNQIALSKVKSDLRLIIDGEDVVDYE